MGTITLTIPAAQAEIQAGLHATNYNDLQTLLNGNIDATNIADASVTRTELANVTRKVALVVYGATLTPFAPTVFPDAALNTLYTQVIVPDDYVSGDLTWKILLRALAGSGTAVLTRTVVRYRSATATSNLETAVAQHFISASTNDVLVTGTVAAAGFQAGDILRLEWTRAGADGSDTLAAGLVYDGGWIEYTGKA